MLNFITAYNKSKFTITKTQNNLAEQNVYKILELVTSLKVYTVVTGP